ncbi:MAG: adenylosuccinate synthetase, partial [Phycisphaerales bacterium JB039]
MTQGTLHPGSAAIAPAAGRGTATAVVGLQWGDEGKGKLVDLLAADHDLIVRYNGGANAGHSVVVGSQRYALHLVPSGILYPGKTAVIANGVAVDPEALLSELEGLQQRGVDTSGLVVSSRAHVVMPYHKHEDELRELALERAGAGDEVRSLAIGTTKRGIGPCYAEKAGRATAVRMGDLLRPAELSHKVRVACKFKNAVMEALTGAPGPFDPEEMTARMVEAGRRLAPMITDTTYLLHDALGAGKRVLFEGGNA